MQWLYQETSDPGLPPEQEGQLWVNTNTKRIWVSSGVDSVDDWKEMVPAIGTNYEIVNGEFCLKIGGANYALTGRVTEDNVVEQGIAQTPTT